jgi:pimeloyl-ACP methyl ester carboxylesterase
MSTVGGVTRTSLTAAARPSHGGRESVARFWDGRKVAAATMAASEDLTLNGVPVVARPGALALVGPVVIVIHGMSTSPETLRAGWPEADDGLERVYWRLPILRDGRRAVLKRRERDLARALFVPLVDEGREALGHLVRALGARPIGLFGFSIGGLLALWGAIDHAAVVAGGVPSLDYLKAYFPDYDWGSTDVAQALGRLDVGRELERLHVKATRILHGRADAQARWTFIADLADQRFLLDP